jgi:FkbM family methyltransferase
MNIENFIREPKCYDGFRETITREIFVDRIYENMFEVEEGDVVFDIGSSLGPFTFSILDKKPLHVFAVEPSFEEFKTLVLNTRHENVTHINKGISDIIGEFDFQYVFHKNESEKLYSTSFKKIIENYNITKIDFLKFDCETCEYDIFNEENFDWIKNNVRKIVGEFHLGTYEMKEKFVRFRDKYLSGQFPNYKIYSFINTEITENLWNDDFIPYFTEIIVHIDNRD